MSTAPSFCRRPVLPYAGCGRVSPSLSSTFLRVWMRTLAIIYGYVTYTHAHARACEEQNNGFNRTDLAHMPGKQRTTVASDLLVAPRAKDKPGPRLAFASPTRSRAASTAPFMRSNTPYVIAGFTVSTRPGLRPSQRPVTPSSFTISRATLQNEPSCSSSPSSPALPLPLPLLLGTPSCWRVAMTDTGMVNICASAPAIAPSASSAAVERGTACEPEPAGRRAARRFMYDV